MHTAWQRRHLHKTCSLLSIVSVSSFQFYPLSPVCLHYFTLLTNYPFMIYTYISLLLCYLHLPLLSSCHPQQLTGQSLPGGDTSPTLTHINLSQITCPCGSQSQGQGQGFCWGGAEAKMALVIVIIHCLLVLLSSASSHSSCFFLSSSCQGHTARVSAEPRMVGVNGVRWQTPG